MSVLGCHPSYLSIFLETLFFFLRINFVIRSQYRKQLRKKVLLLILYHDILKDLHSPIK